MYIHVQLRDIKIKKDIPWFQIQMNVLWAVIAFLGSSWWITRLEFDLYELMKGRLGMIDVLIKILMMIDWLTDWLNYNMIDWLNY